MASGMLHRLVCVSFCRPQYINVADQMEIFEKYGKINQIIGNKLFKDHFFVEFETLQSAVKCFQERMFLLQTFGYIVDLDGEKWDEENSLEPYGGKADYHSPSLLDLNEDCLLHLMTYLRNVRAVRLVCSKLRRIWKDSWVKVRKFRIDRDNVGLDIIYLFADKATHLSIINDRAQKAIDTEATFNLLFQRCENLQRLDLSHAALDSNTLNAMKERLPQLTEISMKCVDAEGLFNYLQMAEIRKLSYFGCSDLELKLGHDLCWNISSLTTVILPFSHVNVAQILAKMPQLRVLACLLDCNRFNYMEITNHDLLELSVEIGSPMEDSGRSPHALFKIREMCPKLRHLRIGGGNIFNHDLKKLLPLDGLCIKPNNSSLPCSHFETVKIDIDALSVLADHLKLFFLDHDQRLPKKYPMILSQFTKLEMTSWSDAYKSDFDEFMKNRLAQNPLKVFVKPAFKRRDYPAAVEWLTDRTEFFGPFSIYRDWFF